MAKKAIIQVFDDLNGQPLDEHETIKFSIDGKHYELDTSPGDAGKLRDSLAKYVAAARQVGGTVRRPRTNKPATLFKEMDPDSRKAFREWASDPEKVKAAGLSRPLGDRGAVPDEYVEAYRKAHTPQFSDQ